MSKIDMLLGNYTFLGEQGTQAIMRDILSTKKFRAQFADVFNSHQKNSSDDKLLRSLAKDYIAAKDKDSSRLIRRQGAKVTSKLLIGDSLKGSNLNVSGVGQGRNRVETARAIGRVSKFGDERRRLLSIVAQDFSMSEIQKHKQCMCFHFAVLWTSGFQGSSSPKARICIGCLLEGCPQGGNYARK